MTVLQALLYMALGGVIVEVFEIHAWRRYQQGKQEGRGYSADTTRRIKQGGQNDGLR